jgi:hypothetical protein
MSELGDLEHTAESEVGGEQDAEHTAVQDGEQEMQSDAGDGAAGDVDDAADETEGVEQEASSL